MSDFEAVIGLEVHAQLATQTKLFCACSTAYGAAPNTQVCAVCLGLPGALPVVNGRAMELAAVAGFSLGCDVRPRSVFDRKSYFYPDLAKGYQISQLAEPLCLGGLVTYVLEGEARSATLTRIHVEEDAAKNLHVGGRTVVDFNRAGTPLIEIVGEPELRSGAEAEAYLRALREVLMFAGVNDGNLEEGSFRCDANVSIRPRGSTTLGTRVELKNINSFRFVRLAIESEIRRQEAVILDGGKVVQETRGYDEGGDRTFAMRSKEEAHDYRYFPDPDLPPVLMAEEKLAAIAQSRPESAESKRARWPDALGLTEYDAGVLTAHPEVARYVEAAAEGLAATGVALTVAGKKVANFVMAEILRDVETDGLRARFPVSSEALVGLLGLVEKGTINGKIAKDVLARMRASGEDAATIVDREGLAQVTDAGAIEAAVDAVLAASPSQVAQYKSGKTALVGYFVGQVMKATKGQANPAQVQEILKAKLG
ncbi:MAG: Asp-tRNA(Asn)/Glu-tRNA(Gln) amidotransferase subunit GatB [Sandaracinus sp.]|nr:Asp-tRNA(Asn)/Glu-tRNA(Gln) amidotransferase subunit GatB [Sandaracinus sp.]